MHQSDTFSRSPGSKSARLFGLCLIISLLLHLGIIALLKTNRPRVPEQLAKQQKPTIVHLVDTPRAMELDPTPVVETKEPPPESARQAERDQRVEKEQAPKGLDSRDQTAAPAALPEQVRETPRKTSPAAKQQPPVAVTSPAKRSKQENRRAKRAEAPAGQLPRTAEKQATAAEKQPDLPSDLPSLTQLTQLTPATIARSQNKGRKERIKEREGIEEGDTVWLNLEKGLLISFFRRFRNQIEGVWNYPLEAARNEIEGILLLKITVDREGELLDVELLKTSGSDILDYEAIEAVYRSAPFGPLPRHYQHPELKIFAHFRYILTGKYIHGRQ